MALLFFIISMILLVLYFKEHNKNKKIESDYKYINARLLDIINNSENNYILIPSDIKVVKETAKGINNLLEKFNDRQIDYNRNQKVILQIFTNISHDLRTPITVVYDLSNCPIPDYPNCLETAQSCVHNSSF